MSLIYLVRHGQASFGRTDYDKLSELGERQARALGDVLATRGVAPTVMVTGTMQRQRVTGSRLWEAATWESAVEVDEDWNECDHDDVLRAYKPAYRSTALMKADLARHRHPRRAFQEMFVEACARWASGEYDDDYAESFAQFGDRVALALGRVTSRLDEGQSAVVVTSGGPMSWIAASLLTQPRDPRRPSLTLTATPAPGTTNVWLNLSQVTVNTGVTTLLQGRSLTLLSTNDHTHLTGEKQLVTYR